MKKTVKMIAIVMALSLLVLAFAGCEEKVIPFDEETANSFIFEAENATIVGKAMKHDYFAYQGDGHIVDGIPSMSLEGGLMAEPSGNGLFVGYMGVSKDDYVEWQIEAKNACVAYIAVSMSGNYKGPGDPATMQVLVNGEKIPCEVSGNCLSRAFSEGLICYNVQLKKGVNTIRLMSACDYESNDYFENQQTVKFLDVDYLKISANVAEGDLVFKNHTEIGADEAHQMNPNGKITKYVPSWYQEG